MKSIYTLVPDIEQLVTRKDGRSLSTESIETLSRGVARGISEQFGPRDITRRGLRLSALGDRCPKALWHSVHTPELAEPLPPWAEIKFAYGRILEEMALTLAKAAGHDVQGEQDELVVDGVVGHRDAVVDGCVVDVKSCSSIAFSKFKEGTLAQDDAFGYLYQLDGYVLGSADDPLVTVKDKGYILAIDKTLGHMYLYEHKLRIESITSRIRDYKRIVNLETSPQCRCGTREYGGSGNIELDTRASYSPYKHLCFPELRTFLYKNKSGTRPVYLTKVVRAPDVPELSR